MDCVDSNGTGSENADYGNAVRGFVDALPWCVDCDLALTRLTQLAIGLPDVGIVLAYLPDVSGGGFTLSKATRPDAPDRLDKRSALCAWFHGNEESSRFPPDQLSPQAGDEETSELRRQLSDFEADAAFAIRSGAKLEAIVLTGTGKAGAAMGGATVKSMEFAIAGLTRVWAEMVTEERAGASDQISAGVAHDIRSCLASVSTLIQLCGEDPIPLEKIRELAPTANANLKTISQIVGQARKMTRATPFQTDFVDIAAAFRKAVALTAAEAKETGVRISIEAEETPRLASEEVLLIRSLRNLISNAIRVSPQNGEVRLNARENGGRVEITVADDGPGMGIDTRRKALSARLADLPAKSGLGLSICRNMIELLGGSLTIEAREGLGTTVTLSLPATTA